MGGDLTAGKNKKMKVQNQAMVGGGNGVEPKILLGNTIDGTGRSLHLNVDKPHNIAIIGPSGTGKTMLLSVLGEGLILKENGLIKNFNRSMPLIVLDLLGNMHGLKKIDPDSETAALLNQDNFSENVSLNYIPSYVSDHEGGNYEESIGFNRLTVDFSKITEAEVCELLKISLLRDTNMANIVKMVIKNKPQNPSEFYQDLVQLRENPAMPDNLANALDKVIFRAADLLRYSIFKWNGEEDIISELKERKSVVVNCEKSLMEAKEVTNMWIRLALNRLKTERRKANDSETQKLYFGTQIDFTDKLPSFWLAIDEVHRLNETTKEAYSDFVRTARNWNCSTIVSTQCVDDIDKDTRKNLTVMFLGRMSEKEALKALKDFPIPINPKRVLNRIQDLMPGQFLVLDKISGEYFYLNTRERVTQHLGATRSATELMGLYDAKGMEMEVLA